VIYVGAKTGRDGIHGATMASEEFTEGSEQKRPNVQMGDPFMEKLLLEACLEAMATGAVLGIQDMGAAGLTCSTCEMGARGDLGLTVELDLVPQRETGMSSYEIMLSESQERMLLVADKPRAQEVLDVFAKWGLDASIVGTVTEKPNMVITQHGELVADIPNKSLTDDAPLYHRPVGTWKPPVPLDPPAWVLEELKKPRDYTADLKKLLASANICDKRWVFEQYDSMVQTNTVQGPGGEAGVMRIKGTGKGSVDPMAFEHSVAGQVATLVAASTPQGAATLATGNENAANPVVFPDGGHESGAGSAAGLDAGEKTTKGDRGLAMALAGNGRWTYLDPKLGAMHAVAEAARKVACTGATPVAATNCLNFGNPEKPEIMAQLSSAIDGIAEACTALGTPVTGGNVSLYNETKGEGIYPTPVIGVVGIIEDVTKAVPSGFQTIGDAILLLSPKLSDSGEGVGFGSSAFARVIFDSLWGGPPALDIEFERRLHEFLGQLAERRLIHSAADISDGGLAVTLAKCGFAKSIGVEVTNVPFTAIDFPMEFSNEFASCVIVTCDRSSVQAIEEASTSVPGLIVTNLGITTNSSFLLRSMTETAVDSSIAELHGAWSGALESQLADEVVTA
jgi:phosphoribosylformylglycinamidine (FGAM) synthase-like enzyme